jgi:hypothetical protein
VDHPSDAQLVAFARKYFVAKDRMLSQLLLDAAAARKARHSLSAG